MYAHSHQTGFAGIRTPTRSLLSRCWWCDWYESKRFYHPERRPFSLLIGETTVGRGHDPWHRIVSARWQMQIRSLFWRYDWLGWMTFEEMMRCNGEEVKLDLDDKTLGTRGGLLSFYIQISGHSLYGILLDSGAYKSREGTVDVRIPFRGGRP